MSITRVQTGKNFSAAAVPQATFTYTTSNPIQGNLLVLFMSTGQANNIRQITDTLGNIWLQVPGTDPNHPVFYTLSNAATGACTVTVKFNVNDIFDGFFAEVNAGSGFLWQVPNFTFNSGSGTSANSGSENLVANCYLGSYFDSNGSPASGSGWTIRQTSGLSATNVYMDQIEIIAGPYSATGTQVNGPWNINMIAFAATTLYPVTIGVVSNPSMPDVYSPKVADVLYDSLSSDPTFTANPYGPQPYLLTPI